MEYGDRGYRGCEGVIVCGSREMRAKRQVVEGVISQIKLFNAGAMTPISIHHTILHKPPKP